MVARRFMARGSKEVFFLEPIELSPAAILAKFLPASVGNVWVVWRFCGCSGAPQVTVLTVRDLGRPRRGLELVGDARIRCAWPHDAGERRGRRG
jgi:hypothetical protein